MDLPRLKTTDGRTRVDYRNDQGVVFGNPRILMPRAVLSMRCQSRRRAHFQGGGADGRGSEEGSGVQPVARTPVGVNGGFVIRGLLGG